jgi:hypothetical protein
MEKKLRYFIYVIFMGFAISSLTLLLSCKPKGPDQAIVTFVLGDVKLERQGESARTVKHRDVLKKDDVISTGKDSLFAFQIAEDSVIRIPAESKLKLSEILNQNSNKFYLEKGSAYATVKKLSKGSTYEIESRTATAAVRGTEFSVREENGRTVIAVKEGSVRVQKVSEDRKVIEEKDIDSGSAAEVSKDPIVVRPMVTEEKQDFVKVEKIIIIKDIQNKSESDLIKIEKKAIDGGKDVPVSGDDKKDVSIPSDDKSSGENKTTEKNDTPAVNKAGNAAVWTIKGAFKSSEAIIVNYNEMPESKYCWISVAKVGSTGKNYSAYDWTQGRKNGQMIFEGLSLEPGQYEVRAHFNRTHNVDKRSYFRVE